MAKLKIVRDEEFLRKKSKPVTVFDGRLCQLIDDMFDTLRSADGLGLAAVQVGVLYRVCLVATNNGMVELVNPEIIEMKNLKIGEEGCLSVPRVHGNVERPHHVTVRAFGRYGKEFTVTFEKISAVCICHEIDHMDGILFTDRVIKKA